MTNAEIKSRIKMTIDQYYSFGNADFVRKNQLQFIGGVLQTALHLLNFGDYYEMKMYIFEQYGYDAGGCTDGQLEFVEVMPDED